LCAAYTLSMARDLSLYDSGELALAARQLGLGHPPGQPLHTLLGHVLCWLPGVPALVAINLASALPAALSLIPATSIAQTLLDREAPPSITRATPWLLAACALHPILWEPATRIEVYALANFFALWAFARLSASDTDDVAQARRSLLSAGIALGLSASVNPMIALCMGLVAAPALVARVLRRRWPLQVLTYAVAGGLLGLAPYLYLPIISRRSDVMVWGVPRDLASFWHYVSLRDYAQNQHIHATAWLSHIFDWFALATQQFLLPVIALGSVGQLRFGKRSALGRAAAPCLLSLSVSVIALNSIWYIEIPDYNGYMANALWLAAAGVPALCSEASSQRRAYAALLLAILVAGCAVFAAPNILQRSRQRDHLARELATHVFAEAPRNAIVIAEADHFAGSLFYLQEAEHLRPDVVVLAYGLASSRWHWEHLQALHPDLQPIALQGPDAKRGRVLRLLAANPQRAVLVEHIGLAAQLGLQACPGGVYLRTNLACAEPTHFDNAVSKLLARSLVKLERGSPGASDTIARTSYALGEALYLLGYPNDSLHVLLAGVPTHLQPVDSQPPHLEARSAPRELSFLPWQRPAALGDPARNLLLVAIVLEAQGHADAALAYVRAAQRDGLPEADAWLAHSR
jgi:hypothetical protein